MARICCYFKYGLFPTTAFADKLAGAMARRPKTEEIEITPEMIEAGERAWLEWGARGGFSLEKPLSQNSLYANIWRAMESARLSSL